MTQTFKDLITIAIATIGVGIIGGVVVGIVIRVAGFVVNI